MTFAAVSRQSRNVAAPAGSAPMIAFLLRRLLASVGVLIAVGLIAFAMFRYVGDPVNQMVGIETSAMSALSCAISSVSISRRSFRPRAFL